MSTPDPALAAASPYLKTAIDDVIQAVTTIFAGDPLQFALRVKPALGILVNQLELLVPSVLTAEQGVVGTDIVAQLTALKARLP